MPTVIRKIFTDETEEELLAMTRAEATLDLTDKEMRFCETYIQNKNIRIAAIKAGYSKTSAHIVGWKLRQKVDINRYIAWLKLRVCRDCHIDAMDIIDQYARIAFADINDFVTIKNNRIKVLDGDEIDGQLVVEVKQGKDGLSIKLADKLAALEKLERYLDVMPKDWKQKIEERKLELLEKRLEIERMKVDGGEEIGEDDGFIAALRESAKQIWDNEVEEDQDNG